MSSFCSHSHFVLPFVFVSLVLIFFRSTSLSSISCAFIFLFNRILSAYFLPLFFLVSFLVICSFVFMSCTFPSVSGHSPLMQHCKLTHFHSIDVHFMTSHRFMSEGFGIHLVLLKLQQVQYGHISCMSKIEEKNFAAYWIFVVMYLTVVLQFTEQRAL
jgi:hypothetical protein